MKSEAPVIHGYLGENVKIAFAARRMRSWPPLLGQTANARTEGNQALIDRLLVFCDRIGYRGALDVEFRHDSRTSTDYLIDFNPRVGAPVCLFEGENGIDVPRAMHLDLSGREVPMAEPLLGRHLVVEQLDFVARFAYRRWEAADLPPYDGEQRRFAWAAWDDPVPFIAMVLRQLGWSAVAMWRRIRTKARGFAERMIDGEKANV